MATDAAGGRRPGPLLTFGRVDVVRVQVGYRARPDGRAYEQFLLDVPLSEERADRPILEEPRILAALEPVLYVGAGAPRHYSLHQHRWHSSWGASPGAWEIGLLVTTGTRAASALDVVTHAFHDLLQAAGPLEPPLASRDAAILRARRSTAMAYSLDPDTLALSTEQHQPGKDCWQVRLGARSGDAYDVVVGLVDGYPGSVHVRQEGRIEVSDAVGYE